MSQSKFIKRLRRETIANPKKALFLGLLTLAAIYFWAPLMGGWFTEDDSPSTTAVADPAAGSPAAAPGRPKTTPKEQKEEEAEVPRHHWGELARWMDNDPRTSAAILPAEQRDPFVTPRTQIAKDQAPQKPKTANPHLTPKSLGMELSSTIVGPRRRLARISGKTYKLGQTVTMDKDGQQITFTLVEVHPRRVVLEREGMKFELKIPSRGNSGLIELTGTLNPD